MLELNFHFHNQLTESDAVRAEEARLKAALEAVSDAERRGGPRAGVAVMLSAIGVRPSVKNDAYYAEALAFYQAQTYAHLGDSVEMARAIERSGTLPADGGDLLFADHVARSLQLFERREAARRRGMPTFLIASMARAASTSLTQSLARSLDMPVLRTSLGRFPHCTLAPSWLNNATPGGAVLHDHFGATPENLRTLCDGGVREVFVLARDPRAAAASTVDFVVAGSGGQAVTDPDYEAMVLSTFRHAHLHWLEAWIAASKAGRLRVWWIRSHAVVTSLPEVWRDLLSAHAPTYPGLNAYLDVPPTEVRANFVNGGDDRWRRRMGEDARRAMWAALSPAAIELLDLEP